MTRILATVFLSALLIPLSGAALADEPLDFVLATQREAALGQTTMTPGPGVGEEIDATRTIDPASSTADLPVLDRELAAKIATLPPTELVRVIIELNYQPQDLIGNEVRREHQAAMQGIKERIRAIQKKYALKRNRHAVSDTVNYSSPQITLSSDDKARLRSIQEEHEALSLVIKNQIAARLRAAVEPYQSDLGQVVMRLGGEVEFGTICVNALVARVPVGSLEQLARTGGVARLAADRRLSGDLENAAIATGLGLPGALWDDGYDGGIYDPAVIDSGTDLSHPGLEDASGRDNFWSWYLVAANGDPWFNDVLGVDDFNGHGTHVMGIVGSYGTAGDPDHLGMSHGVEKAVTLKAGWQGMDNRPYMYDTDAMNIIDRALYDTDNLYPVNSFNDDVDGFNLSYGGEIETYEDDYSRFFDSIVSSYSDLVVTVSAGNSGPANTLFRSPACSYNVITVANVDDQNTPSRDDDVIRSSSTRGPTNDGRRKPDIAAPGSYIESCNTFWESGPNYISASGTSMSAPMVQGAAMCLMDAGVTDELEIKALLLNTAQKNEGLIDFEGDADGWSETYGWGYMNTDAARYHVSDLFTGTVTARPNPGYYRLYKGQMHDEGPAWEGRDRATMVWNRHATYNPADFPTSYYNLSDLNMRLYGEEDNDLIDTDTTGSDNVHQVRIDSGAGNTDVVIKTYAWSTSFNHGGSEENYVLATEEDFVEVDLPTEFQCYATWPQRVEPNEEFEFSIYFVNNSEIASHNNLLDLTLPAGWTLLSGSEPVDLGSFPGGGGVSAVSTFTVRAQSWTEYGVDIDVDFEHDSYGEIWNAWGWNLQFDVQWDTTPPSPDPMNFQVQPYGSGMKQISMTAVTATDGHHPPVEYYFDFFSSPTGGSGGSDSGWQAGAAYTDNMLSINNQYGYRVGARDSAHTPNITGYSSVRYSYTLASVPETPVIDNPTTTTLDVSIDANGNPGWTECAIYLSGNGGSTQYYLNASGGSNGGTAFWQSIANWNTVTATGLTPGSVCAFRVAARNGEGIITGWSPWGYGTTSDIPASTISATYDCVPSSGIVPFSTSMSVTMNNLYTGQIRRIAGRIEAVLAGGAHYDNWRSGFTNVAAGGSYNTAWNQSIPALSAVIGTNMFVLVAEDVTPAPYNQPPYPAAGDTDTGFCVLTAYSP